MIASNRRPRAVSPEPPRPHRKLVALNTGASAGLGAQIARELARREDVRGLALAARRLHRLEELAQELRALHPSLDMETIAADLAAPVGPEAVVDRTSRRFGAIDVLVNNAGMGLPTLFADGET